VTAEYRRDSPIDTNTEKEQTVQQIMEMLTEMNSKLDASHKMMAMLDAHHERTVASFGKTEATDFKATP
jgi:hypothetical protein